MLTIEQYRNPGMRKLYQQYLAGGPLEYVAYIFEECGSTDPELAALHFYAPMFTLYSVFDKAEDEKAREAAKELAERFFKEMEK